MVLLDSLPRELLLAIFDFYSSYVFGVPVVWRLTCRAMRDSKAGPTSSSLSNMGSSIELAQLMHEFIVEGGHKIVFNLSGAAWVNDSDLLRAVVTHGNPRVFQQIQGEAWAHATCLLCPSVQPHELTMCASAAGSLEVLQLLVGAGLHMGRHSAEAAVTNGEMRVLHWLMRFQKKWSTNNLDDGFARKHFTTYDHPLHMRESCEVDLVAQFHPFHRSFMDLTLLAAKHGQLDAVKLLLPQLSVLQGNSIFERICKVAAQHGQLAVLIWGAASLDDAFADCIQSIAFEAGFYGKLEVLQWLYPQLAEDTRFDHRELIYQRHLKNLNVVKWLVEDADMQLTPRSMLLAILCGERGNFALMDYLHSKGCPRATLGADLNYESEFYAAVLCLGSQHKYETVAWLHEHGYEPLGRKSMRVALQVDDLPLVQQLLGIGFELDTAVYGPGVNVRNQNYECCAVVRWARNNGYYIPAWQPTATPSSIDSD